jgi:hypothetical protein
MSGPREPPYEVTRNLLPPWPLFAQSTRSFKRLYEQLTIQLEETKCSLPLEQEQRWLQYLIDHFESEYFAWERKPELRKYLEITEQSSGRSKLLRVLGHAYLHLCYDLPRVLANSFTEIPLPDRRAHNIYSGLTSDLLKVFSQALSDRTNFWPLGHRLENYLTLLDETES